MENMDPPLPVDTQKKLLRLSCIYTQAADFTCSPAMERENQPVYTLESLQKMLWLKSKDSTTGDSLCPDSTLSSLQNTSIPVPMSEVTEDLQEQLSAEILAERAAALRGSPWQICVGEHKTSFKSVFQTDFKVSLCMCNQHSFRSKLICKNRPFLYVFAR